MIDKSKIIFISLVFFVGLLVFKNMFTDDELLISSQLDKIESIAEYDESLKPLQIAQRVTALQKLIAPHFAANLTGLNNEVYKVDGWTSVKNAALIGARVIRKSQISRVATQIEVFSKNAEVNTRYEILGIDDSGNQFKESISANIILEKVDGEWIVSALEAQRH